MTERHRHQFSFSERIGKFRTETAVNFFNFLLQTVNPKLLDIMYYHPHRVEKYAIRMSEVLGLNGYETFIISKGARLHDIGKLWVDQSILLKREKLTDEELEIVKRHPDFATSVLNFLLLDKEIIRIVRHHQERWDGLGYPDGLEGDCIPLGAQIVSIVDTWDSLTTNRPYRIALTYEGALKQISEKSGIHFDPNLVEIFSNRLYFITNGRL